MSGQFLNANLRFCAMVGYTRDELLSMRFVDITHPDDQGCDEGALQLLASGKQKVYEREKRYR